MVAYHHTHTRWSIAIERTMEKAWSSVVEGRCIATYWHCRWSEEEERVSLADLSDLKDITTYRSLSLFSARHLYF